MPVTKRIALMRGINVGGKNKLPMKSLASLFVAAGCESVATYIQSGNVMFQAGDALAAKLPTLIGSEIARQFGFSSPVILRTASQLRQIISATPFPPQETSLAVAFLQSVPDPALVSTLDPNRSPPDRYVLSGDAIYLDCRTGLAKTKLTNAYFDSKLKTVSTIRNWNTVLKLAELMGS